ncbi:hypothetical protein Ddc_12076 [Ditylenchus destructor]|nr:hypothetical protein Ddc_12076 [Ditylenchus destructor]
MSQFSENLLSNRDDSYTKTSKPSSTPNLNRRSSVDLMEELANSRSLGRNWFKILFGSMVGLALILIAGFGLAVQLEMVDTGDPMKSFRGKTDCKSCFPLTVRGDQQHLTFDLGFSSDTGCQLLTVTCGKQTGTEAIVQWYHNGKDLGVSFMDHAGQSRIVRKLPCNDNGEYELDENGEKGAINEVECIVAEAHEEL